ncbi:MAG: hypothetical protein V4760_13405 [Bdellovibrionota bacterium]
MKNWLEKLAFERWKIWMIAIVVSGAIAFAWDISRPKSDSSIEPESPETASTFIPAGFVLVPIEVANYESLDSILGKFGVVDLFKAPEDGRGRSIKVAERVKILRAPLNPSHFAVLVPDSESSRLVSETGAFTVVVQNPSRDGTRFVNDLPRATRSRQRTSRIAVEVINANP